MVRPASCLLAPLLLLLCAAMPAPAASTTPATAGASAADLARLLEAVERDPQALDRHRDILEQLTPAQMALAIGQSGNSHFTWLYPMILRAQDYPALAGTPITQLSVMAVRGDRLVPIPFQVDEFDVRGLVYIPGVATPGPLNPGLARRAREPDGVAGRYDGSDELVFMYRDGGRRQATAAELAASGGKLLAAVRLERDGLPPRYAYVMKDQPLRSPADYVKVDLPTGTARTSVADISWDPRSMAMLRNISPRVGPARGRNIVDGVYGEVSTGVMQKNLRFSLNTSDNIRIQPVAVRDGPVRALMLVKVRVFYAGLPVFHDFINVALYEQGASLLARVRLDSLDAAKYFITLIKEPRIEATIDFSGVEGAEVRWQSVDHLPDRAIVDGRMNGIELAMDNASFPGDWLWMDSRQGWQFFYSNGASFDPDGLVVAFLEGMDIDMVYEDDPAATRAGEREPGAGPRFGVRTSGMPLILTSLLTSLRGVDLGKVKDIEDLMQQLVALDERGRLDRLNLNIALVHERLRRQGRINSMADIAELLARDIRRMGFRPAEKARIEKLARRALLEGGSLEDYRLGNVLKAALRIAREEGIDLKRLQYAMLDNSLWFPDQVGTAGPAGFDREVRNPPVATLLAP